MALVSTYSNLRNRGNNNTFKFFLFPDGRSALQLYSWAKDSTPQFQKHWYSQDGKFVSSLGNAALNLYPRKYTPSSLDIEDSSPNGGPLHAPQYGFSHLYLPSSKYTSQSSITIENRLELSNLDTQVPINVPSAGFVHLYTSNKKFVDDPKGQKIVGYLKSNIFSVSGLDLEVGNPINDPSSGFIHKYTPFSKFSASTYGQKQNGRLKTTFDLTDLDLENPLQIGGPINAPLYGFAHTYLPNNQFSNTTEGAIRGSGKIQSSVFQTTALDLESNQAGTQQGGIGGPINDPISQFVQTYTPQNPYTQTQAGVLRGLGKLYDTFKVTALDIENRKAGAQQGGIGGPNRTSFDYPIGLYENISTYSGKVISQGIIQEWTPKRTYMDFIKQRPAFPG